MRCVVLQQRILVPSMSGYITRTLDQADKHGGTSATLFHPAAEQGYHKEDVDECHLECEGKDCGAKRTVCGTSSSIDAARQLQR